MEPGGRVLRVRRRGRAARGGQPRPCRRSCRRPSVVVALNAGGIAWRAGLTAGALYRARPPRPRSCLVEPPWGASQRRSAAALRWRVAGLRRDRRGLRRRWPVSPAAAGPRPRRPSPRRVSAGAGRRAERRGGGQRRPCRPARRPHIRDRCASHTASLQPRSGPAGVAELGRQAGPPPPAQERPSPATSGARWPARCSRLRRHRRRRRVGHVWPPVAAV